MKQLTTEKFEDEVLHAEKPIVVLFDASWCPFCRAFRPIMESRSRDLPWPIVAVLLENDDDPLWDRYEIAVVPTLAVFESGRIVFRADGTLGVGLGPDDIARLLAYARGKGT